MQRKNIEAASQAVPKVELSSSKLYGWEYMDVVTEEQLLRRRQLEFHGNWQVFTEDVLVLFGRGFRHVIQPAAGVIICKHWNPIPPKQQFLTATVDSLKLLSRRHGGHLDYLSSPRLTNTAYWNFCTSQLFRDCEDCCGSGLLDTKRCSKRAQYLERMPSKRLGHQIPPSEGAVVFGYDSKLPLGRLHKGAIGTPTSCHVYEKRSRFKRYFKQLLMCKYVCAYSLLRNLVLFGRVRPYMSHCDLSTTSLCSTPLKGIDER